MIDKAAKLVPAQAIAVLEATLPRLKYANTRESYERIIAELKALDKNP